MAAPNPGTSNRTSPMMIGVLLGLGLLILFFLSLRGGDQQAQVEPHPWRVLTINNVAVARRNLPVRVICPLPEGANAVSDPTADCYFRASIQYNPPDDIPAAADCQLADGFSALVVGVGEDAEIIGSRAVDLAGDGGDCDLHPGAVVSTLFEFESVPRTERLSLIRFVGIDPPLELDENLRFVIDQP